MNFFEKYSHLVLLIISLALTASSSSVFAMRLKLDNQAADKQSSLIEDLAKAKTGGALIKTELQQLKEKYDALSSKVYYQGVDIAEILHIKQQFFDKQNNVFVPHLEFYAIDGVALGCPFADSIKQKLVQIRSVVIDELQLMPIDIWLAEENYMHVTIVGCNGYNNIVGELLSEEEMLEIQNILAQYSPVKIEFRGIVLTASGALLAKGYPCNDFFDIRKKLGQLKGIHKVPGIAHVKLAQILSPIDSQKVVQINHKYAEIFLGSQVFKNAIDGKNKKIFFMPSK